MYKYNFFYKTQNLLNGKFYCGIHSTDDLNDGYLGSGFNIKESIKKYGKENFLRDILIFFESREKAFEYEESFLNEEVLSDSQCYNISPGGNRGGDTSGKVNVYDFKSDQNFMVSVNDSRYIKGDLVPVLKGFVIVKDSSGFIQKVKINDENYLNGIFKSVGKKPKGPNKNKTTGSWKLSLDARDKIRRSRIGKIHAQETKDKIGKSNLGHNRQSGKKHSQYDKKWIINPVNQDRKLIDSLKVEEYLKIGWVLGRKLK